MAGFIKKILYGKAVIYEQNHFPIKVRNNVINQVVEALWLKIHWSHYLVHGCCHRPACSTLTIMWYASKVTDVDIEVYSWGYLICALKERILVVMNVNNMTQMMMNMPTRVCSNMSGIISTCIDHIYTNASGFSSVAISSLVSLSNHNWQ